MRRITILVIVMMLVVFMLGVGIAFISLLPKSVPSRWTSVSIGMDRSDVYRRLGEPDAIIPLKGEVWHSSCFVGRWEHRIFFSDDNKLIISVIGFHANGNPQPAYDFSSKNILYGESSDTGWRFLPVLSFIASYLPG